ncbi:MAG: hypothetical protein ACW980_24155 [Promethearchaeota archaeon]|jgi:hypothetical protein
MNYSIVTPYQAILRFGRFQACVAFLYGRRDGKMYTCKASAVLERHTRPLNVLHETREYSN